MVATRGCQQVCDVSCSGLLRSFLSFFCAYNGFIGFYTSFPKAQAVSVHQYLVILYDSGLSQHSGNIAQKCLSLQVIPLRIFSAFSYYCSGVSQHSGNLCRVFRTFCVSQQPAFETLRAKTSLDATVSYDGTLLSVLSCNKLIESW